MDRGFITLTLLIAISGLTACSDIGAMNGRDDESSTDIEVTSRSYSVPAGGQTQLTTTGGSPPYSYSIAYGQGSVSPTGVFTAPVSIVGIDNVTTIQVEDSLGHREFISIQLVASQLTVNYTPNPPSPRDAITLNALDGSPPYLYQKIQGFGTMSNNVYTAPGFPEIARINVIDAKGKSTTVTITIGSGL